jgi:hypothetical protein
MWQPRWDWVRRSHGPCGTPFRPVDGGLWVPDISHGNLSVIRSIPEQIVHASRLCYNGHILEYHIF